MVTQPSSWLASWTSRRVVAATLVIMAVVLSFVLLYRLRMMVIIIFMGIMLSMAIAPAVTWLYQRGIPRAVAVIGLYLSLLAVVTGFLALALPLILNQAGALAPRLSETYHDMKASMLQTANPVIWQIGFQLPAEMTLAGPEQPAAPATGPNPNDALTTVGQAAALAGTVSGALFTLIGILILGFYWTLEGERALRSLLMPIPPAPRADARNLIAEIEVRVGGYIRGQALLALSIGLAATACYLIIGIPSAAALGLIAAVMELVPVVGPLLGAIPALLVTWAIDPSKLIWVVLAYSLIQFFESNVLGPRIMHHTVGVNAVVTLLSIIAFGALFGFPGLLLAIPIAAIIQLVMNRTLLDPATGLQEPAAGRDRQARLRYEAQQIVFDVHKYVREKQADAEEAADRIEDEIEAIAADLDRLLRKEELEVGAAL